MGKDKHSYIIAETPFPSYAISTIGDRHFLLGGGGGAAKTGVPNEMLFFYMDLDENGTFRAVKTLSVETGSLATGNLDVFMDPTRRVFLLATGQDKFCKVYKLEYSVVDFLNGHLSGGGAAGDGPAVVGHRRRRTTSKRHSSTSTEPPKLLSKKEILNENGNSFRCLTFKAVEIRSFQSDHHAKDALQKVVRFSPDGRYLATGGSDGHFRTWSPETGHKIQDHNAHKEEIIDIAISPDGKYLVTIGRDSKAYAWCASDASKYSEIKLPQEGDAQFRFRTAKFANFGKAAHIFYTAANPISRRGKNHRSVVSQWALVPKECRLLGSKVLPREEVSSMTVNHTGRLLALGTMNGSVHIWDGFHDLKPIRKFTEVHSIFVTGLQFLPPPASGDDFTKLSCFYLANQCGVISISADNTARLNVVPYKRGMPSLLKLSFFFFAIFLVLFMVRLYGS